MKRTVVILTAVSSFAQTPWRILSPEVHESRTVTFRFPAPNAKDVFLSLSGSEQTPMQKDERGVWTATTAPLEPDFYPYSFVADGAIMADPNNPDTVPNLLSRSSMLHVPGPASLAWERGDSPHGTVSHHFYDSGVIGDRRDYYVYTPPGYDEARKTRYPVLYLLHGFSDDASAWTAVGRAHFILDNLITRGAAKPMIVVMPLGYGAPEILSLSGPARSGLRQRNMEKFRDALLKELVPRIEKSYRAATDRQSRAIAGLSMGGAESLFAGLNTLDRFAWIGAFSSGGLSEDFDAAFPKLESKAGSQLRLLWIACGTGDRLIDRNRKFIAWLNSKGIRNVPVETPGAHTWMVWRRNLAVFAPLLFRAQ